MGLSLMTRIALVDYDLSVVTLEWNHDGYQETMVVQGLAFMMGNPMTRVSIVFAVLSVC